jgi:hypothetical protein
LLILEHAPEYGVIPSLAPDGRRFVYTALAPETRAPAPDAPAGLWLATTDGTKPRMLADGVDLLVRPVWSADGSTVAFRRSPNDYKLMKLDLKTGQESELVASADAALFPVSFTGERVIYTAVDESGSSLRSVSLRSLETQTLAHLSSGLTRDWKLSPGGDRLAYLEMTLEGSGLVTSRALVLDIVKGDVTAVASDDGDEFSPAWSTTGELAVGRLAAGQRSGAVQLMAPKAGALPGPERGFDAPLEWSPAGDSLLVRSFEGTSITAPGRSILAVIDRNGGRQRIAGGEITLVGWVKS